MRQQCKFRLPRTLLYNVLVKINYHSYVHLIQPFSQLKKRHHRNKYLGLLILNLYATLKIFIQAQQHDAYTQHQEYFFLFFTIITKKNKQKILSQKNLHSYDTYTLLIFYQNQKGTSNKFCPRNIFILMIPILHYKQKEEANNFVLEIFSFL